MNPILDQLFVAVVILGAMAYFVFRKKNGCGAGCDCGAKKLKKP